MTRLALAIMIFFVALLAAVGGTVGWIKSTGGDPVKPARIDVEAAKTVFLKEMTWTEVAAALRAGIDEVIIPTGGVEQNGPHMILGKHDYIVRHTAGRIAGQVGGLLVAPVMSYVPQGRTEPARGHMAFPGTLSLPENLFANVLRAVATSLKVHGFKRIYLLGDSGGNQPAQAKIAKELSRAWRSQGVSVIQLAGYYDDNGQMKWLLDQGESRAAIGGHAGIRDTSELLAVYPEGVRRALALVNGGEHDGASGVRGDPSRASKARGQQMLKLKIAAAVAQIKRVRAAQK